MGPPPFLPSYYYQKIYKENILPPIAGGKWPIFWGFLYLVFLVLSAVYFARTDLCDSLWESHIKTHPFLRFVFILAICLGTVLAWFLIDLCLCLYRRFWLKSSNMGRKLIVAVRKFVCAAVLPAVAVYLGEKLSDKDSLRCLMFIASAIICYSSIYETPDDMGIVDTLLTIGLATVFNIQEEPGEHYKYKWEIIWLMIIFVGCARSWSPILRPLLYILMNWMDGRIVPTDFDLVEFSEGVRVEDETSFMRAGCAEDHASVIKRGLKILRFLRQEYMGSIRGIIETDDQLDVDSYCEYVHDSLYVDAYHVFLYDEGLYREILCNPLEMSAVFDIVLIDLVAEFGPKYRKRIKVTFFHLSLTKIRNLNLNDVGKLISVKGDILSMRFPNKHVATLREPPNETHEGERLPQMVDLFMHDKWAHGVREGDRVEVTGILRQRSREIAEPYIECLHLRTTEEVDKEDHDDQVMRTTEEVDKEDHDDQVERSHELLSEVPASAAECYRLIPDLYEDP